MGRKNKINHQKIILPHSLMCNLGLSYFIFDLNIFFLLGFLRQEFLLLSLYSFSDYTAFQIEL